MSDAKFAHVIGGGTVSHVRAHLALSAVSYGTTAKEINQTLIQLRKEGVTNLYSQLHLTRMAAPTDKEAPETVWQLKELVDRLVADPATKIIFFNPAVVDFDGKVQNEPGGLYKESGKYSERLKSRSTWPMDIRLTPTQKIVQSIRAQRKDIFLVAFKTTCGAEERDQYLAGLNLLKEASANLVLANDIKTRLNMVITPEEAAYSCTKDREEALNELVHMALLRSHLTFTRSTVVDGQPVPWNSPEVPEALRKVVDYCIQRGAYQPFRGSTVGHFAAKIGPTTFLTSRRKTNFNDLDKLGLVRVETDGPDSVIAYGSRPSVGGQSQRIVFSDHPEMDCVLHFHCVRKSGSSVPIVSQREFECGSHECGKNTSNGLKQFGNLKAVFLDSHGPNIVFHRSINPQEVIDFVEANFFLDSKTGGYSVKET